MRKFCNRNIHTKKTITNRLPFPFCTFKTTYMLHPNGIILPLRESGSRFAAVFLISWSSPHPISNSQLRVLPHFHPCPIYLVVFKGVYFLSLIHIFPPNDIFLCNLQPSVKARFFPLDTRRPVSYTHLDVYKRQISWRIPGYSLPFTST